MNINHDCFDDDNYDLINLRIKNRIDKVLVTFHISICGMKIDLSGEEMKKKECNSHLFLTFYINK